MPRSARARREPRGTLCRQIAPFGYAGDMYATAVVGGKVVRFKLSPVLVRAHRENRGKTMSDQEAVAFVEGKRRQRGRALRRAKPVVRREPGR